MIDHFEIPPHLRRVRPPGEKVKLTDPPKRKMIYPKRRKPARATPFSVDPGSATTLKTFGWTEGDIRKIRTRAELDRALDKIENPANWKTKD